jgi:hypothetical protein
MVNNFMSEPGAGVDDGGEDRAVAALVCAFHGVDIFRFSIGD